MEVLTRYFYIFLAFFWHSLPFRMAGSEKDLKISFGGFSDTIRQIFYDV